MGGPGLARPMAELSRAVGTGDQHLAASLREGLTVSEMGSWTVGRMEGAPQEAGEGQ